MRTTWLVGFALLAGCGGFSEIADDVPANDAAGDASIDEVAADTGEDAEPDASMVDTAPPPTCLAAGATCGASGDCCSASCLGGKCAMLGSSTLDDDRDRLLETYALVQKLADRCAAWSKLDGIQKGIFLTHTDMLGNRSCVGASKCAKTDDQALPHVFQLWAMNGSDPGCSCTITSTGYNCCNGGGEWHRVFFTADDRLIQMMRDRAGLPEWKASSDLAGPHAPFSQSNETSTGSPRGQIHFWAKDADASSLKRTGVTGVNDPHIVELDNDYNLLHDSNPEGCYGVFGLGCSYGRVSFKKTWSDKGNQAATTFRGNGEPSAIAELAGDAVYAPRCPTAKLASVAPLKVGNPVKLTGAGFGTGNVVHLRSRAGEAVLSGKFVLAESATEITLFVPSTVATGETLVWTTGSTMVRVTLEK